MHYFYCTKIGNPGEEAILDDREYTHLFRTLRMRPGEEIGVLNGRGITGIAVVAEGRRVVLQARRVIPPPEKQLTLFLAVPKKQKMDQLLKQLSEIGVSTLVPIRCEHSVVAIDEPKERWTTILLEGCKQSGNPLLPAVSEPMSLAQAVKFCQTADMDAYFGEVQGSEGLPIPCKKNLAWFVGPEGGFTIGEEQLMRDGNVRGVRIAEYVLRVETAAIAGALLLLAAAKGIQS